MRAKAAFAFSQSFARSALIVLDVAAKQSASPAQRTWSKATRAVAQAISHFAVLAPYKPSPEVSNVGGVYDGWLEPARAATSAMATCRPRRCAP